ncbi:(-)-alpha-terpineol synthase-like [Tripterygium wilfordii]|uniref:(-)-alpha-terpineol synthase-like n=1 Tax=Tripterygium wilfordii TaxID=458696 RepID=A0A7J7CIV5_TRIWF|nr:(-)-alpha-terpineol synthase-like [Tripterygium wilfordii]
MPRKVDQSEINQNPPLLRSPSFPISGKGEVHTRRVEKLKGKARILLNNAGDPLHQLELIDTLQRLGLGYNFKLEIETILHNIYSKTKTNDLGNLYATALQFRLLRQHGYHVPQVSFKDFIQSALEALYTKYPSGTLYKNDGGM